MRKSEVVAEETVSCLNLALIRLKDVWEEIGISEEQRLERTDSVREHIKTLLDMMISEELRLKLRLEKSVESSRREINNVCSELQLCPPEEDSGLSLLQAEQDLRTTLDYLLKEKNQRLEQLQDLLHQDQELCRVLGTCPSNMSTREVPTLRTLEDLTEHVRSQREEKSRRELLFRTLKDQIQDLMWDLNQRPDPDLDSNQFCLSSERLEALGLQLEQLQSRRSSLQQQNKQIQDQIQSLCEKLKISANEREEATKVPEGTSLMQTVMHMDLELQRLTRLKCEKLKSVCDEVRAQISEFWEKCFCSEEERLGFTAFYCDQVSDQVLEVLEAELQRLKHFYERHRPIIDDVRKWIDQWEQYILLETKASDVSRFKNRGGNLLKEEKQKSDLSKNLNKLERSLRTQISLWEEQQHSEFLVKGSNFLQFVEQQWNQLHEQREREREERLLRKARQTEEDMLYGTVRTPTKRRFIGSAHRSPALGILTHRSPALRGPALRSQSPKSLSQTRRTPISGCSLSTNSTLRSVRGGVSPRPRPSIRPAHQLGRPVMSKPGLNQDPQGTKPGLDQDLLGSVASYSRFMNDLTNRGQQRVLSSSDI
ncbi:unnamed protein product [Knipowitschia caucasica]